MRDEAIITDCSNEGPAWNDCQELVEVAIGSFEVMPDDNDIDNDGGLTLWGYHPANRTRKSPDTFIKQDNGDLAFTIESIDLLDFGEKKEVYAIIQFTDDDQSVPDALADVIDPSNPLCVPLYLLADCKSETPLLFFHNLAAISGGGWSAVDSDGNARLSEVS